MTSKDLEDLQKESRRVVELVLYCSDPTVPDDERLPLLVALEEAAKLVYGASFALRHTEEERIQRQAREVDEFE
jgi:hypothetical protein